jgi:4-diphosphocytidyl-2-C-methyl-D-erythritol kinase
VTSVTVRVPAKLNLQLAVGPRRTDGYHDLVTVFHAISLYDEITVEPGKPTSVSVTGEGASSVPSGQSNLAVRAFRELAVRGFDMLSGADAIAFGAAATEGVRITIHKRIPVAAGMAGGSADAAGTLVAVNELWGGRLTQRQLCEIGARIGSDVPFGILGGTVVGRGRGELLTPALVRPTAQYHWVLALADGELSTPLVYQAFDRMHEKNPPSQPELSTALMTALRAGDPVKVGRALGNDLQPAAVGMFPALRKTLTAGKEFGALGALVAGSGPTCFFLAANARRALDLAVSLTGAGVCRTVVQATGPAAGAAVIVPEDGTEPPVGPQGGSGGRGTGRPPVSGGPGGYGGPGRPPRGVTGGGEPPVRRGGLGGIVPPGKP